MAAEMMSYVNGFMLCPRFDEVLLIRKNRPEFQRDKWNGIGGKIEAGEDALTAMVREFWEETGVHTSPDDWTHTLTLAGSTFVVYFYRTIVDIFPPYRTVTDELVGRWTISDICSGVPRSLQNMRWILPLQLQTRVAFPLTVQWTDVEHGR